ncbi:MAG: hypothetical protein ACJA1C_002975, partial [Crocinitomicaceae bacterium]
MNKNSDFWKKKVLESHLEILKLVLPELLVDHFE